MSEQPNLFEPARPHARMTDPVSSDRTVKSLGRDGALKRLIWEAMLKRTDPLSPCNDTLLWQILELLHSPRRFQRSVIARTRGLMQTDGYFLPAGMLMYEGVELYHYRINKDFPSAPTKEKP